MPSETGDLYLYTGDVMRGSSGVGAPGGQLQDTATNLLTDTAGNPAYDSAGA